MKNTSAVEVSIQAVSPALICMPTSMTAAPLPQHAVDHRSPLLTRAPEIAGTTLRHEAPHVDGAADDAINRPSGSPVAGATAGVHREPAGTRPRGRTAQPGGQFQVSSHLDTSPLRWSG